MCLNLCLLSYCKDQHDKDNPMNDLLQSPARRQLISMIGKTAGVTAMYQAMTTLGFASESSFKEEMNLKGAPAGASIVILGAGLGGLTAAYELRKAGYKVTVLSIRTAAADVAGHSIAVTNIRSWAVLRSRATLNKAITLMVGHGDCPSITTRSFITAKNSAWHCSPLSKPMIVLIYIVPITSMVRRSAWVKYKAMFAVMYQNYYPKR